MRIPKRLEEARKIIKEKLPNKEEAIQESLKEFRNFDFQGVIKEQDRFDEIIKDLNQQEKDQFEKEFNDLSETAGGFIEALCDALEDPEDREKILDELKRRVRG